MSIPDTPSISSIRLLVIRKPSHQLCMSDAPMRSSSKAVPDESGNLGRDQEPQGRGVREAGQHFRWPPAGEQPCPGRGRARGNKKAAERTIGGDPRCAMAGPQSGAGNRRRQSGSGNPGGRRPARAASKERPGRRGTPRRVGSGRRSVSWPLSSGKSGANAGVHTRDSFVWCLEINELSGQDRRPPGFE